MLKLISEDCFKVRKLSIYEFSLRRFSHILLCDCVSFYTLIIIFFLNTDFSAFTNIKISLHFCYVSIQDFLNIESRDFDLVNIRVSMH